MNYIDIDSDNLQELKDLEEFVVKRMEIFDKNDDVYKKLSDDLWKLDAKIIELENRTVDQFTTINVQ